MKGKKKERKIDIPYIAIYGQAERRKEEMEVKMALQTREKVKIERMQNKE